MERLSFSGVVVKYFGDATYEDIIKLKLSDAFEKKPHNDDFEWTAVMYNINLGHNREIMDKCLALRDYSIYVEKVKTRLKAGLKLESAVRQAIDEAISENLLNGFFKNHEKGVLDMTLTEFNEAEFIANRIEEGRTEGRKQERINAIQNMLYKGITKELILNLDYTEEEFRIATEQSLQKI